MTLFVWGLHCTLLSFHCTLLLCCDARGDPASRVEGPTTVREGGEGGVKRNACGCGCGCGCTLQGWGWGEGEGQRGS